MKVVIINYNAGNTKSVENALLRLNVMPLITHDAEEIASADKVIFPGVGHALPTMHYLKQNGLDRVIKQLKQPVLGICLGQQLMCKHSEEGDVECLGIFDVEVKKFNSEMEKVPHMGWNGIKKLKSPLFHNLNVQDYVYFVHSYYSTLSSDTIAETDYVLPFSAALNKANFYAVQFHPEKSASVGNTILQNFLIL